VNFEFTLYRRAREATIRALERYSAENLTMRSILRDSLSIGLTSDIRSTVFSLTLGVIRYLNTIDYLLTQSQPKLISVLDSHSLQQLRLGVYESKWLNIPIERIKSAYVDDKTLFKIVERAIEVNLKNIIKDMPKINSMSLQYSHPTFLIETLLEKIGEQETVSLLKSNNSPRCYYARPNLMKTDVDSLSAELASLGIIVTPDPDIENLLKLDGSLEELESSNLYNAGNLVLQDKGSLLVVRAVNPKSGETIFDVCSAPGGKTQYIWELMNREGRLVAGDFYLNRIQDAKKRLEKLGEWGIQWIQHDGASSSINEVSKILIDAPCTSTGMIKTHPSFKWALNKDRLMTMMTLQNKILEDIIKTYQKSPDTEIVFATCSVLPHEGESQIDSILKKYPIELIEPDIPGETGYSGFICSSKVKRLFSYKHETHDFFIARFRIKN